MGAAAGGFVPILGDLNDAATVFTGRDALAGQDVGWGGRVAAGAGALLPISGGTIRAAGDFLSSGASALAKRWGTSFNIRVRGDLGADGASSAMIREADASGNTVSMTHRVVSPDGNILHQHQTHVGRHGTERQFPDEWVQFPEKNK